MANRRLVGELFTFDSTNRRVAFSSGCSVNKASRIVIFIAGLTDGLLATEYVTQLAERFKELPNTAFVNPLLSSAYNGYGTSSLARDVEELDELIAFLGEARGQQNKSDRKLVLIGHSTGCQISVSYCKSGKYSSMIDAVVLQAPVSDRELYATFPRTATLLEEAKKNIANGDGTLMAGRFPNERTGVPVTWERFASLAGRYPEAADDMFSSDLTDAELDECLGCLKGKKVLIVTGTKDECIPAHVDRQKLSERLARAAGADPRADVLLLESNHALDSKSLEFSSAVFNLVKELTGQ